MSKINWMISKVIASLVFIIGVNAQMESLASEPIADLVVINARLLDGNGKVREGTGILLRGGKIQSILMSGKVPEARRVIDARGGTVMPGLIDTHVHLCVSDVVKDAASLSKYIEDVVSENLSNYLSYGVTTIRSMGDPEDAMLGLRARIAAGEVKGPRLQVVGPGITMVNGHPAITVYGKRPFLREHSAEEVNSVAVASDVVNRLADKGVDAIKIIYEGSDDPNNAQPNLVYQKNWGIGTVPRFSLEVLEALISEAHKRGLSAIVHTVDEESARSAVFFGADALEHGLAHEVAPVSAVLKENMRSQGVFYSSTLQVYDAIAPATLHHAMPQLKRVANAGVKVVVGTDTFGVQLAGDRTIREMELMVDAGLDAGLVIWAATGNAADSLGLSKVLGSLEPGKIADIIVVNGDPLKDISTLRSLSIVIQNGQIVYENNTID